jgi:hypothetical protein
MTRYEFATAIARLLPLLQPANNNYATKDDLAALRSDLENRLAQNQAALDALTRLVNEFQPELLRLGQDVAAIQTRLANLEGRVAVLEAEQQRLHIGADINVIAEADNSTHKAGGGTYAPFFDKNGVRQPLVNAATPGGSPAVATNDFFNATDVYNDIMLHLKGKLSDTATANVDLDFQNYESNLGNTARAGDPVGAAGQPIPVGGLNGGVYSTYVYQAYLDTPVALGPLAGASIKIGLFGEQFTKWTLMQADSDIYTRLYQTDSGNLLTDGGSLDFKLGPVGIATFAGKFNTTPFSQAYVGTAINPAATNATAQGVLGYTGTGSTANNGPAGAATGLSGGAAGVTVRQVGAHPLGTFTSLGESINNAAPINQGAGARFTIGSPSSLVLGASVEQFSVGNTFVGGNAATTGFIDPDRGSLTAAQIAGGATTPANAAFNRVSVYGVDLNGGLPFAFLGAKKNAITLSGAYTVSAEGANSGFNNVGNKTRFQSHEELVGFHLFNIAFQGGYQFVGPYFSAPGYWGKIGAWTNPTNVKGGVYFAKYPITPRLSLNADYEQYQAAYGTNDNGTLVTSPLQSRDHVNRYQAGVGYGLSSAYAVDLGYERVQYDLRNNNGTLAAAGKPTEDYITIGLGHSFNQNASFKLLYQIVHYNDHGTGFGATTDGTGDNNYSGNVAVGQFSLKF